MDYQNFGQRLKGLQQKKGIKTQKDLATWLGFSTSIVSEWLRGEKIPSLDTAVGIAAKFGCAVEWLITGKETYSPNQTGNPNIIDLTKYSDDQRNLIEQLLNFIDTHPTATVE